MMATLCGGWGITGICPRTNEETGKPIREFAILEASSIMIEGVPHL
jgi:hypothetical protein